MVKLLSIRQPWVWAILHAGKRVENRTWASAYRGPILLHAGKTMTRDDVDDFTLFYDQLRKEHIANDGKPLPPMPDAHLLPRGGILGAALMVDCTQVAKGDATARRWFFGPHGFALQHVNSVPFMPLKGGLGLLNATADIVQRVRDQGGFRNHDDAENHHPQRV